MEVDENRQEKLGLGITYFILTLCFCGLGSYFLAKNSFTTLPDCIIYVFAGIIVGTGLRLTGRADTAGSALPNQQEFFLFIIPPIIFEAGYSMNKKSFFEEAIPIFLFAVVGTIITALVFGVSARGVIAKPCKAGFSSIALSSLVFNSHPAGRNLPRRVFRGGPLLSLLRGPDIRILDISSRSGCDNRNFQRDEGQQDASLSRLRRERSQ